MTPITTSLQQPAQIMEEEPLRRAAAAFLALWARVANSRPLAYLVFAAIYTPPSLILAHHKLLWDDEFFTLYLSTTKNWSELMRALATGADQHPPSFYYLTHLVFGALGVSNLTLRLTAMLGFFVMCVCLYEIVSRLMNREWGFCAMILPLACPYYSYALEARGYGVELGFAGIAMAAWMLAGAGQARRVTVPVLAASICGAVASHYYGVMLVAGLAAGELTRTMLKRRIDWPIWFAFGAALLPVAAFWRVIQGARLYAEHFWAVPRWRTAASWYPSAYGYALGVVIILGGMAALRMGNGDKRETVRFPKIEIWSTAALVALTILPIIGLVVAKLATHAFTNRYAIAAFPAGCILMIIGFSRAYRYSTGGAAALWVILLAVFGGMALRGRLVQHDELNDVRSTAGFLRQSGASVITMSDITRFHRISFYARRDLGSRVVYLANPHEAIRYLGFDTLDRGLLDLNPWFPLNVRWLDEFVAARPSFVTWAFVGEWSWFPNALVTMDAQVQLVGVLNACMLLSVKDAKVPPGHMPGDPSGQPMLYSSTPVEGKPMCQMYMPASSCPVVDSEEIDSHALPFNIRK
jgi:hypothetical protein